jgi:hypothetical protein
MRRALACAALLLALLLPAPRPAAARPAQAAPGVPGSAPQLPARRFALLLGNDRGGADTRPLLYAAEDARRMHALLLRLGGVQPEDATLLLQGSAPQALEALASLEARAARAAREGARTVLLVYYSGHAKDGALRLGDTPLPLAALRERLVRAPADVRIGILDACRSGAVTRTKGVRRAPAFEVDTDAARTARGLVLLTSSAADEDSQEADHLGGSYFTHHLASGLLGDADRSGDGRVSLAEAYAYAYERTVADTADTGAGAQHPTFSFDLAGNGDVLLTEVGGRRDGLALPAAAPAGAYFLVDAQGRVAAEVHKPAGEERRLALPPGRYRVKRRLEDRLRVGEVEVAAGRVTLLEERGLRDAPFTDDPVKGRVRLEEPAGGWRAGLLLTGQGFWDARTRETLFPRVGLLGVELQLRDTPRRGWVTGLEGAMGASEAVLRLQGLPPLRYRHSQVHLAGSAVAEWPLGPLVPYAGARLALLVLGRTFAPEHALPHQSLATLSPGVVAGVRLELPAGFSLGLRGRAHGLMYGVDDNRLLGFTELSGMVTYAP